MSTRDAILTAALKVLEEGGSGQFSRRAVCATAKLSTDALSPLGNSEGLLNAALAEDFRQFLDSKNATIQSTDAEKALREGWDDYVPFAAARPRLYTAMIGRLLDGAQIEQPTREMHCSKRRWRQLPLRANWPSRWKLPLTFLGIGKCCIASSCDCANTQAPCSETIAGIREAAMTLVFVSNTKA